jgi:hypothetical protein
LIYNLVFKIEDGTHVQLSDLLGGQGVDPDTGEALSFSQVDSTNTYTATVSLDDGRTVTYYVDAPSDPTVKVSRVAR